MEPSPRDRRLLARMNDLFQESDTHFRVSRPNRDATRYYDQMAQAIKSDLLSRGFRLGVDPHTHKFFFEDSK